MNDQPLVTYAVDTSDADQTRALGEDLGRILAAGDLVMLSGGLGAGKTTLTQGIGVGMGVRGRVASPTFIVARVHPSQCGGPDLIHADAYRITDLNDLETLDLDSSLDESVTVVEWGDGKTEAMSADRLVIEVRRASGGTATSSTSNTWTTGTAASSCARTDTAGTASSTRSSPPMGERVSTRPGCPARTRNRVPTLLPATSVPAASRISACER